MFEIDVRTDIKQVTRYLNRVQRKQVPFATARTLQIVGRSAQQEVGRQIRRVVDRPKPITIKATQVWGPGGAKITNLSALKRRPVVTVMLRDEASKGTAPAKYLGPLTSGGVRRHKGFEKALIRAGIMRSNEYAVPGDDLKLNKFGNIPAGAITAMLSQLRSSPDPLQNATRSRRSKGSRRGRAYFVMRSAGFRGVMVRTGKRSITSFLYFVTRKPSYKKVLPFGHIVSRVVRREFVFVFNRELKRALRTAR